MRTIQSFLFITVSVVALTIAGCSSTPKAADVKTPVHDAMKQAGLTDVSVDQDRDKGVVTLGGHVATDAEKTQAENIAKGIAVGQVVADQIAVLPPGSESAAKNINSDLDKGIEKNLQAALLQSSLSGEAKDIKGSAKNGVVTLTGTVNSPANRQSAQTIVAAVPNVQQVVNEIQVKNQPASSTN